MPIVLKLLYRMSNFSNALLLFVSANKALFQINLVVLQLRYKRNLPPPPNALRQENRYNFSNCRVTGYIDLSC